jgi:hypothetical protein
VKSENLYEAWFEMKYGPGSISYDIRLNTYRESPGT